LFGQAVKLYKRTWRFHPSAPQTVDKNRIMLYFQCAKTGAILSYLTELTEISGLDETIYASYKKRFSLKVINDAG